MLKTLLVALIASAFTVGAYAQAQKAEPKGQSGTTTQPATAPSAKGDTAKTNKAGERKPKRKAKVKTSKAKDEVKKDTK